MRPVDPRLLRYASVARWYLAGLVVVGAVTAGLVITQAWLLAKGLAALSVAVVPALIAVVGARALLTWATEWLANRSATAVKSTLRREIAGHTLRLGPRYIAGTRSGEVTALLTTGLDGLDVYLSRYLPQLVLSLIVPVVVLITVVRADLIAGITIIATLPLIPVFMALIGIRTQAVSRRRWRSLATLSHHFQDVVAGLATLKAFGRAAAQPERVRRVSDDYRRATMGTLRLAFLSSLVLELLSMIAVALVAVGVGLRLAGGEVGFRTALFVLILTPEAYAPLRAVGASFHAGADGLAAIDDVDRVLSTPADGPDGAGERPPLRGDLVVTGLSVRHPGRPEPAPGDLSVRIRPGEFVAVAGPSGCGKSTLLGALLGFVTPDAGSVRIGEVDQATVDPQWWRRHFAWVPQEPYLLAGTVRSNIALGAPDASAERIAEAAGLAALDIDLDIPVADGGVGLSAGQRRRVGIARAIIRDAPVLLLDEPTAGLDEASEARILEALRRTGRTVVAVAHRPATLAGADRVVTLSERVPAQPDPAVVS